jgi:transglutaminase-like putative cysteine protease
VHDQLAKVLSIVLLFWEFILAAVMMQNYLEASEVIDWQHPAILELAEELAAPHQAEQAIAKACFEWVRDQVTHSVDYQMNPVTCRASEVLQHKTGYCFAKSHLLAALIRANQIPAGFCYQRLSMDDRGAPYCLHGFNAIYLSGIGWYRVDPRGNRAEINAQFTPPIEQLAYGTRLAGEVDFQGVLAEPLPVVVRTLQVCHSWEQVLDNPPDMSLEMWQQHGFASELALASGDS